MPKDPYRYFRIEAQELLDGLGQGLLDLEKEADPELVRRLLRQAHTLKGAARVVKQPAIGDLAHAIEDLLSPHRESEVAVERPLIDDALALVDEIRGKVDVLGAAPTPAPESEEGAGRAPVTEREEPGQQTIRVAIRDLDTVLQTALEAHTTVGPLGRQAEELEPLREKTRVLLTEIRAEQELSRSGRPSPHLERAAHHAEQLFDELGRKQRALGEQAERVIREIGEVRAEASALRLIPARTLLSDVERAMRDAARAVDKKVELSCIGAETDVDAHVLAGLRRSLGHLVRNSVAHGIEGPDERAAAGKPSAGRVEVAIERRAHRVSIRCRDDGRGLDARTVRRVLVERGTLSEEGARELDEEALGQLLLRGGLSTSAQVTDISGRGVGLDAVRHAVESLGGTVTLQSVAGRGTTVEIIAPVSLSTMPALSVALDQGAALVPLDSVRTTMRVAQKEISRGAEGERVVVDGELIPFLPLERALRRPLRERPELLSAVVLQAEGRMAAVGVVRLGAVRSVVVQAVPLHAAADPVVSGASFDDDGVPQLVLSPIVLVQTAWNPISLSEEPTPARPPPLLVIDDSLTTRMLEQSILESAGYEVDLAVSGEEGLQKARARSYGAFIVDVEMPGMNGFEFLSIVRSDPALRDTPAVMVTSRADAEDKRRGRDLGAQAYMVKSEFDQAALLRVIRRIAG